LHSNFTGNLAKILLNHSFFIRRRRKILKGVFARFRPPQPPEEIQGREAGGWEAESILLTEVVSYIPHPPSSLCARASALSAYAKASADRRASVACAVRSLPEGDKACFSPKGIGLNRYLICGIM